MSCMKEKKGSVAIQDGEHVDNQGETKFEYFISKKSSPEKQPNDISIGMRQIYDVVISL